MPKINRDKLEPTLNNPYYGTYNNASYGIILGHNACAQGYNGYAQGYYKPFTLQPYKTAHTNTYTVNTDQAHLNDIDVYYRHLYRRELEDLQLNGVGKNLFNLPITVERDDTKICEEILNKFNNNMGTNFEQRLHDALKRKNEIQSKKHALIKQMQEKYIKAQTLLDKKIKDMNCDEPTSIRTSFQDYVKENPDVFGPDIRKSVQDVYKNTSNNPPIGNDDNIIKDYIMKWIDHNDTITIIEENGIKYIDIIFNEPISQNNSKFFVVINNEGKVINAKRKIKNKKFRKLEESLLLKPIFNIISNFFKKEWHYKKVRLDYNKVLKKAKIHYGIK